MLMQEIQDLGLIPESGRSPREGNGNPLQYSCLENPMDRGARWAVVHGVTEELDTTEYSGISMYQFLYRHKFLSSWINTKKPDCRTVC